MKTTTATRSRAKRLPRTPAAGAPQPPRQAKRRSATRDAGTEAASPAATAVLRVAEDLHAMEPTWIVFFNEMLGVDGHAHRAFPEASDYKAFECSPQYARIRELLNDLRSRQPDIHSQESRRVVTVRMPLSLHESLKAEARQYRISINQLCISKLIRMLDRQETDDADLDTLDPFSDEDDDRGGADL